MTSRNACQGYEPWAAGGDFQGRSSFGRLGSTGALTQFPDVES